MDESRTDATDPALREHLLQTAQMLLLLLGERSAPLKRRSERAANLSANFAAWLGLDPDAEVLPIYLGALLQNIGLAGAPEELLSGPHAFAAEPPPELKHHPVAAVGVLVAAPAFNAVLPIVRHHHEAFDGRGYPDGLGGAEIPLGARVLHLCDAFDELAGGKAAEEPGERAAAALEDLAARGGGRFDPELLARFGEFVRSGAEIGADFQLKHKAAFLRQSLTAILAQIRSGKIIPPAMPRVATELHQLVKRSNVTLEQVCRVVERDPVIAARLVSVANSPAFRGYEEIKNLQAAVPRLGLKEVLAIVVAIAQKSIYDVKHAELRVWMDRLWVHSLACGFGAKLLARHLKLAEPETVFLMGLTHDIGKAVLLRAFCEQRAQNDFDAEALGPAVQELHVKVGEMLLRRWGFGSEFVKAAALHERTDASAETVKEVLVVQLANLLTRRMGLSVIPWDGTPPAELKPAALLNIEAPVLEGVERRLSEMVRDVSHLF
jgi:putative nucleotidyltransferase with HDIG domain